MKKIPGYDGYLIDEKGNVFSEKSGSIKPMKKRVNRGGYETIALKVGPKYSYPLIHRMVLEAFVGPSRGLHCNHKNGNRSDNRLENLEWVTRSENERHARRELGKLLHGDHHPCSKLNAESVRQIRSLREEGRTYQSLANQFGICLSQTARIANGRVWRHV